MKRLVRVGVGILLSLSTILSVAQESDCEAGLRFFSHPQLATDSICISVNPERIAVLDPFTFEFSVVLDIPLIATPEIYIDEFISNFPAYADRFEDVTDTGVPVNLEALLFAQPDIILCRRSACENSFEQLREIAPTVMFDNEGASDWRESSRFYAQVLDLDGEIAYFEDTLDERLDALASELEMRFGDTSPTISVLRVRPGQLRFYFEDSFAGTTWSTVGLTSPETQSDIIQSSIERFGSARLANISTEQIPLIDADYVFVFVTDGLTDGDGVVYLEEIENNPLWQALHVVQDEQLYVVDNYWFVSGYIGAHAIIDDLFTLVLNSNPSEIAPNPFSTGGQVEASSETTNTDEE